MTPPQSRKRQLDAVSASDSLLAKRARLTQTDGRIGSLRSSARLQALRHPASSRDPTRLVSPAPPCELQTETGARSVPKRARLTRKNLQLLNRMIKSKLTTETHSTTSSGFEAQALKNGILDRVKSKAPANLNDRRTRLNRKRETASPTESMYGDYVAAVTTAPNEQTMIYEMAKLLKEHNDRGYRKVLNQAFTAFPKEVGFNNGLSAPQPDLVEGLQLRRFLPFPVDEQLDGAALIKDDPYSITLPHLAGEWKGPGKDMNEARMQSAYDGAALVYERNQALEFLGEPDPPDHAAVSSFTTDGTTLNFFCHHSAPSKDRDKIEYHQCLMTFTNLMNSFDGFEQGRKQLRNLQEDARDESYALRDRLQGHWKARQGAI
ncbi:hypothetical protein F5X99DRAFT_410647 [Biscogniauxia marginata]|nr:hypothetical protein F5X99DRAFT_410647 [Biscogniauxia marginata]